MAETPRQDKTTGQKNQGEGNRDAARAYNEDQQRFVKSGQVDKAAEDAKRAVEGREGDELRRAEEKGKSRAAELDPQVHQDFRTPSKN